MKKLTIEQKAQRYDEAINIAKKFYTPDSNNVNLKATLEMIFPELKESEDERIRKKLIDYFKENNAALAFRGISNECVIAWLEKQGEQKPIDKVEPKFKAGDKVLVDGKVYTIKLVNEDNYIVDENGRDVQEHFSYTKDWKLYEQKPTAWSEEDETALGNALWCCKQAASIAKNENDMGNIWYAEKWLRTLKDRVQPHPTWKPSDEQMKVLNDVMNHAADSEKPHWNDYIYNVLKDLIKQLKKL